MRSQSTPVRYTVHDVLRYDFQTLAFQGVRWLLDKPFHCQTTGNGRRNAAQEHRSVNPRKRGTTGMKKTSDDGLLSHTFVMWSTPSQSWCMQDKVGQAYNFRDDIVIVLVQRFSQLPGPTLEELEV